jgi:hypothetical protein
MTTLDEIEVETEMDRQRRAVVQLSACVRYWRDLALLGADAQSRADMRGGEPPVESAGLKIAMPAGWKLTFVQKSPVPAMAFLSCPGMERTGMHNLAAAWSGLWKEYADPPLLWLGDKFDLNLLTDPQLQQAGLRRVKRRVEKGASNGR